MFYSTDYMSQFERVHIFILGQITVIGGLYPFFFLSLVFIKLRKNIRYRANVYDDDSWKVHDKN